MSRSVGRRRAEPTDPAAQAGPVGQEQSAPRAEPSPPQPSSPRPQGRLERLRAGRLPLAAWTVLVLGGVVLLGLNAVGPAGTWASDVGAVVVAGAYAWALAARTGGRPVVFGGLALVLGGVAVVWDLDVLRTGAAVLTCSAAAVLGVMATVPARRFRGAAREVLVASAIGAVGALASLGFEPVVRLGRFEYVTLALALAASFAVVWRLGAGLHGLGRRGFVVVLAGAVLLAVALTYAELLRRYGAPGLVETVLDGAARVRDELGALPRPTQALLGIPALVWGCHMRARRRQGWWVCAFGVAATLPLTHGLVNPAASVLEVSLSFGYSLVLGLAIGYVLIRLDLTLTGSRGSRGRRAEEATAGRPEPPRTRALL